MSGMTQTRLGGQRYVTDLTRTHCQGIRRDLWEPQTESRQGWVVHRAPCLSLGQPSLQLPQDWGHPSITSLLHLPGSLLPGTAPIRTVNHPSFSQSMIHTTITGDEETRGVGEKTGLGDSAGGT